MGADSQFLLLLLSALSSSVWSPESSSGSTVFVFPPFPPWGVVWWWCEVRCLLETGVFGVSTGGGWWWGGWSGVGAERESVNGTARQLPLTAHTRIYCILVPSCTSYYTAYTA